MLMRVACVAAAMSCVAGAPAAGGLVGILRKPYPNQKDCTLNRLDYATGANTTIASLQVCYNATEASAVAVAGIGSVAGRQSILFTTGSGDYWGVDVASGAETLLATRGQELAMGAAVLDETLYVIAEDGLYTAPLGGAVQPLKQFKVLPLQGGTGPAHSNGTHAFVSTNDKLITIDLASGTIVHQPAFANSIMDIQYRPGTDDVLALYSYQLFTVDLVTGAQKKVADIPDGDGFPGKWAYDAKTETFFFGDFDFTYSLDPATGDLPTRVVYNAYLISGNYFFVPDAAY